MQYIQEESRLKKAKIAFTTRRVPLSDARTLRFDGIAPKTGDIVLARVDELGHHKRIEGHDGRRAHMYPGDEIIVCYGNRYAPDQFEAVVPGDLGPCHLVAGGGIAARALSWHDRIEGPTQITPIALFADELGQPLNVRDYAVEPVADAPDAPDAPVVAVVGTSMNAGKTTTAAALVRGLTAAGHRVGAVKLTGTGSGGDLWKVKDAGAHAVLDFTDAGFASTYLVPVPELERGARVLMSQLAAQGCDVIVAEIADGLYQQETNALLRSETFSAMFAGVIFAAQEAMGAAAGLDWLRRHDHRVLAISGRLCCSPLAMREVEAATDAACLDPEALMTPAIAAALLPPQQGERRHRERAAKAA